MIVTFEHKYTIFLVARIQFFSSWTINHSFNILNGQKYKNKSNHSFNLNVNAIGTPSLRCNQNFHFSVFQSLTRYSLHNILLHDTYILMRFPKSPGLLSVPTSLAPRRIHWQLSWQPHHHGSDEPLEPGVKTRIPQPQKSITFSLMMHTEVIYNFLGNEDKLHVSSHVSQEIQLHYTTDLILWLFSTGNIIYLHYSNRVPINIMT